MTHLSLFWLPSPDVRSHVRAAHHGLFGVPRFRVTASLKGLSEALAAGGQALLSAVFLFFSNRLPIQKDHLSYGQSAIEEWSNQRDPGGLPA